MRILPLERALEQVGGHRLDDLWSERRGIDLANALDPAGCGQLHNDEIAATLARRRVANGPAFQ